MSTTTMMRIGFIMLALGVSTADSKILIVPLVLAFGGLWLMLKAQKTEEGEEDEEGSSKTAR